MGEPFVVSEARHEAVLAFLRTAPRAELEAALLRCAGSRVWAERMAESRPFGSFEELTSRSRSEWDLLSRDNVLEAIASHPRIGSDLEALKKKYNAASWSAGEQSGVSGAREEVLVALRDGNLAYEARFGHIFIVCATGKSAEEMLSLLQARMSNEPDTELEVARGELCKITCLRLEKL